MGEKIICGVESVCFPRGDLAEEGNLGKRRGLSQSGAIKKKKRGKYHMRESIDGRTQGHVGTRVQARKGERGGNS